MVEFKSNRTIEYNRINGLDDNESVLNLCSVEEFQRDINNEESDDKWSYIFNDETEEYMILVILFSVVLNLITVISV